MIDDIIRDVHGYIQDFIWSIDRKRWREIICGEYEGD